MNGKNRSFLSGFLHALDGVKEALKSERSMKIHAVFVVLVIIAGVLLNISLWEWIACVALFGLVVGTELINTALEISIDICSPQPDPRAKRVKDTAAAAVLVVSLAAGIVGLIIFVPKVWNLIF